MQGKPLFFAEKQIEYIKHLERLKKISAKKVTGTPQSDLLDSMHRIRHHSSDYHVREKNNLLSYENNKILNKLMEISERTTVPAYSSVGSHCVPKKGNSIIMFNNPERKRRQQQILDTNNKLVRRLMTHESQFDRAKTLKNIQEYESVRRVLQNNRKVKLIPMCRQDGGFELARLSTTQNSRLKHEPASRSVQKIVTQQSNT